jgi:hypothetical protein
MRIGKKREGKERDGRKPIIGISSRQNVFWAI